MIFPYRQPVDNELLEIVGTKLLALLCSTLSLLQDISEQYLLLIERPESVQAYIPLCSLSLAYAQTMAPSLYRKDQET